MGKTKTIKQRIQSFLIIIFAATIMLSTAGCKQAPVSSSVSTGAKSAASVDSSVHPVSSHWTMRGDINSLSQDRTIKNIFETAAFADDQFVYEYIALLGSQTIMTGTNYCFLCRCTPADSSGMSIREVYISAPTNGTPSIYYSEEVPDRMMEGHFRINENVFEIDNNKTLMVVFGKAYDGYTDGYVEPIAYLGAIFGSDIYYFFLCRHTPAEKDAVSTYRYVIIKEKADQTATVYQSEDAKFQTYEQNQ